jgi:hypothetical protein
MDKNTYKALNTDKNPNISFALTSGTITSTGGNNYQLNCVGKLTIAGTVKETDLIAVGKVQPGRQKLYGNRCKENENDRLQCETTYSNVGNNQNRRRHCRFLTT